MRITAIPEPGGYHSLSCYPCLVRTRATARMGPQCVFASSPANRCRAGIARYSIGDEGKAVGFISPTALLFEQAIHRQAPSLRTSYTPMHRNEECAHLLIARRKLALGCPEGAPMLQHFPAPSTHAAMIEVLVANVDVALLRSVCNGHTTGTQRNSNCHHIRNNRMAHPSRVVATKERGEQVSA
jgi:hypothetical protein